MNLSFVGGLVNGARGVIKAFVKDPSSSRPGNKKHPPTLEELEEGPIYYPLVRFSTGVERYLYHFVVAMRVQCEN